MSTTAIVWTVLGAAAVALVVAAAIAVRRDEKRDKMVAGLRIAPLGLRPVPADPRLFLVFNRMRGFWAEQHPDISRPVFSRDRSTVSVLDSNDNRCSIERVRQGEVNGLTVTGFDYRDHIARYVVATVRLPEPRPTLVVTTENIASRLRGDLQLESVQFNDQFNIATNDIKFAYDVLCPPVMEFLIADPRSRYFSLTASGQDITVWQECTGSRSGSLGDAVADYLVQIMRRVPSFVWT